MVRKGGETIAGILGAIFQPSCLSRENYAIYGWEGCSRDAELWQAMGNTASLHPWTRMPPTPTESAIAGGVVNASLPIISVGLRTISRGGVSHAAIGDVQTARRASVNVAVMETLRCGGGCW